MNNTSRKSANLIAGVALIIITIVSLVYSAKWLAAEYYANQVLKQRDLWESYGDIYFLKEWEAALENINKAIALHDSKAEFYRLQGLIYEWRRVAPYPDSANLNPMQELRQTIQIQTDAKRNALNSYRKSLTLRPTWALAWFKVAYMKGMLEEFDEEFFEAMQGSYQYGKNLDFMQSNLTENSLRFFEEIQAEANLKEMQMRHLATAMNSREQIALITRFRLLEEVCQQLNNADAQLSPFANQTCTQARQE